MINILMVGLGGFLGSVLRYFLSTFGEKSSSFPSRTLLINILGSFLIGILVGIFEKNKSISPSLVLFLKVGVCGGFTTFSTFALESEELFRRGLYFTGELYIFLSISLGLLAVYLGKFLLK